MTDRSLIQLLPETLANQIAAGEVVQRPASVVKELLENALDAGASRVELHLQKAGKQQIMVIDNGSGMNPTDARMCFERHATSKIHEADDLFRLHTLGFRGEALASIAAVAQVSLRTRPTDAALGTCVEIDGGSVRRTEAVHCPTGTSLAVRNLFYNIPARRKFLKSNPVETRHIVQELYRVALAYPAVHFVLVHDDERIYDWPSTDLAGRLLQTHPQLRRQDLLAVEEQTPLLHVWGFVGRPSAAKPRRQDSQQYFFANGRFIRSPYLHHAVLGAYDRLLPAEHQPFYALYLKLAPDRIDVNIHPTKTEIKLEDEQAIYGLLQAAVRHSLGRHHAVPDLNLDLPPELAGLLNSPTEPERVSDRRAATSRRAAAVPFGPTSSLAPHMHSPTPKPADWQALYGAIPNAEHRNYLTSPPTAPGPLGPAAAPAHPLAQLTESGESALDAPIWLYRTRYLMQALPEGLRVVDVLRAQQRILYEQLLGAETHGHSQQLLYPQTLEYAGTDAALFAEAVPELQRLGFGLRALDAGRWLLSGVPAGLRVPDVELWLLALLAQLDVGGSAEGQLRHSLALSLAERATVLPDRPLALAERQALLRRLFTCQQPHFAPNGKPIHRLLSDSELEAWFA